MNDDMLINLTAREPSFFSRFTQLVELVGADEADKVAARARYKFYRDRGYEIKNIDHAQMGIV
jgi:DNA polymerase-3 subunit chi